MPSEKIRGAWLVQIKNAGHALLERSPDEINKILSLAAEIQKFRLFHL